MLTQRGAKAAKPSFSIFLLCQKKILAKGGAMVDLAKG